MIKRCVFRGCLALLVAVPPAGSALAQSAPMAAVSAAPAAAAPYAMTLGDMMDTLIQPRHAKLGLAGKAQNWALAQ